MSETKWTEGPWEYIASTEHHGPYVVAPFGGDIADCYTMSDPASLSTRNGGTSKPVLFQHEQADANARLIAAAPDLYSILNAIKVHGELACVSAEPPNAWSSGGKKPASKEVWQFPRHMLVELDAALALARGEKP